MLVDAPFVSSETVRQVLARYRDTHAPVVRPVQGMQHGHPVLIDRSLFPLLRAADPLQGAKPIVRAHVSAAGDVTVEDPGAFTTPWNTIQRYDRTELGGLTEFPCAENNDHFREPDVEPMPTALKPDF